MRIRCRFSKTGKIRWTSHRDLARMWERAFRRVDLPLAYTEGFSPRPKVSFGLALPTGYESVAEYLDLDLDVARAGSVEPSELPAALSAALPAGVDVSAAALIDDRTPSLQHQVTSCSWHVDIPAVPDLHLDEAVERVLSAGSVIVARERKGVAVEEDVRPAILSVTVVDGRVDADTWVLQADLASQPRALRPADLLAALDPRLSEARTRRTHQWISRSDGAREEPLPLGALADAPPDHMVGRV